MQHSTPLRSRHSPLRTFALILLLTFPATVNALDVLEQTRTTPSDFSELRTHISLIPELQVMVAQNRERALWLLDTGAGQRYSVDYVDSPNASSTIRFNPRRCMRTVTDTVMAAKLSYRSVNGAALSPATIRRLKTRAANEIRKAAAQALAAPSSRWPWYSRFNPLAPETGTLEVAEATACLALGYDWLRVSGTLSPEDLANTRQAILVGMRRIRDYGRLRFQPAQCEQTCKSARTCSVACWSNWNGVINGTGLLASVAVGPDLSGEARNIAAEVERTALRALPTYIELFSKNSDDPDRDGAYSEGPGYLNFSLEYFALADVAWGQKSGRNSGLLSHDDGILQAGDFALDLVSSFAGLFTPGRRITQGLSVNFADSSSTVIPSVAMLSWLGKFHSRPEMAAAAQFVGSAAQTALRVEHPSAYTMDSLGLLWFSASDQSLRPIPRTRIYGSSDGRNDVAFLHRTIDAKKYFAVLKGGMPSATPHGHMDAGSFIIEALNRRWSFDMSHDSYDAPNYFILNQNTSPNRWSYLRTNNFGHSTLAIGGQLQNPNAVTSIELSTMNPETGTAAVANLSQAYAANTTAVRRALAIHREGKFIVRDLIEGAAAGTPIEWRMIYCRGTNPGSGLCYANDGRNPIVVSSSNPAQARIQEEVRSAACRTPRFLDAQIVSPSSAQFSSSKLIGYDVPYRDSDGRMQTFQQADNARQGKCYVLSANFRAQPGATLIEIELTPRQASK